MVKYCTFFLLLSLPFWLNAKEIPPKPIPEKLVNDFAGVLNRAEIRDLERRLVAYDDSTSTQIAVVIENSLEGDDVFDYSFRLAEAWGIGTTGKDNGILVYIAIQDRKLFIHVGPGLQGVVTDGMTKTVIDNIIAPNFKKQKYYNGLLRGTNALQKMAEGEFKNDKSKKRRSSGFPIEIIFFLGILIFIIWMNQRGKNDDDDGGGYYGGGRYDYNRRGRGGGWLFFPGSFGGGSSGGGGGGDFGGGGFGGFGGGGFDGGGAGGSW